jgi:hypothetical protein
VKRIGRERWASYRRQHLKNLSQIQIYNRFQTCKRVIPRYSAPSIAAFGEMGPIGERQEAARFHRARDGPSKTLAKSETHRRMAESGSPLLWILSFCEAKESISVVGPRPDFKTTSRDSDTTKAKSTK